MDVRLISNMLQELILNHDQIGLAGLGTFVADLIPASFSDRGYTVNPPYRRLQFHPVCMEENLMAEMYARENGVDTQTARNIIEKFLSELKTLLDECRVVEFPGFGKLRLTRNGTIFFVPDRNLSIYPEGTGLESVSLKTHVEMDFPPVQEVCLESEAAEVPAEPEKEVILPKKKKSPFPAILLISMGAAVIFLLLFLLLGKIAPDFVDSLLYSAEELEIINYKL